MALAIHMADLRHQGEVADYAELARLALVTRARMTQIMSLVLLAPDIQEEILYLPRVEGSRTSIAEKMVRPIAAVPDWRKQRVMWRALKRGSGLTLSREKPLSDCSTPESTRSSSQSQGRWPIYCARHATAA